MLPQWLLILEEYLSIRSYAETINASKAKYANHPPPNKTSIFRLVKQFCSDFTLQYVHKKHGVSESSKARADL